MKAIKVGDIINGVEILDILPPSVPRVIYKFKIKCTTCGTEIFVSSDNLKRNITECTECKPRNQKYKKGDLIGQQKVKFLSSKTYKKEGSSESYGLFECSFCGEPFEKTLNHILKARETPIISCGCQTKHNVYKENKTYGKNKHKLITLFANEGNKDRKAIFECSFCGRHFESTCKQVAKDKITCCGCTNEKILQEGKLVGFNNTLVIKPSISQDNHGKWISLFKCSECGNEFEAKDTNIRSGYVWHCGCKKFTSQPEKDIYSFLLELGLSETDIIQNTRNIIKNSRNNELDIFLPKYNLAIEFNGLYWHSEASGKDKNYHLNKTKASNTEGIHLIHIFNHQWESKRLIIEDIIKKRLNIVDKKIYARHCDLKLISYKQAETFLNENHLQGSVKSSVNIGLYNNDTLVSVMTFGKPRNKSKGEYELYRFCNKLGYSIIGGASKILKFFEREYNSPSIISYCDLSIFTGELYHSLGFKLSHISQPNYFYFLQGREHEVFSRNKFMKHKLKDLLENYDDKLSEYQNMLNNKYLRYYDCGNMVFIKNEKEKN